MVPPTSSTTKRMAGAPLRRDAPARPDWKAAAAISDRKACLRECAIQPLGGQEPGFATSVPARSLHVTCSKNLGGRAGLSLVFSGDDVVRRCAACPRCLLPGFLADLSQRQRRCLLQLPFGF